MHPVSPLHSPDYSSDLDQNIILCSLLKTFWMCIFLPWVEVSSFTCMSCWRIPEAPGCLCHFVAFNVFNVRDFIHPTQPQSLLPMIAYSSHHICWRPRHSKPSLCSYFELNRKQTLLSLFIRSL
jgi:hypothetical protein